MRVLVVFETLWGNTEKVARAVANELGTSADVDVDVVDSDSAPTTTDGYEFVVVGGPTHAFSMTRASTRQAAVHQNGAPRAPSRGIREWLSELQPTTLSTRAAAFDTRVDAPRLPGSAAKSARHELRSLGYDVSAKAKTFRVHDYGGPLVAGELERAAQWARKLL